MITAPEQVPIIIYNTIEIFGWLPALQGAFFVLLAAIVLLWFLNGRD